MSIVSPRVLPHATANFDRTHACVPLSAVAISRHLGIQNKCYRNKDTWNRDRKKVCSPQTPSDFTSWTPWTSSPTCSRLCQMRFSLYSERTHKVGSVFSARHIIALKQTFRGPVGIGHGPCM